MFPLDGRLRCSEDVKAPTQKCSSPDVASNRNHPTSCYFAPRYLNWETLFNQASFWPLNFNPADRTVLVYVQSSESLQFAILDACPPDHRRSDAVWHLYNP